LSNLLYVVNYSVTRVFRKIGETGTAQEIINLLERIT